MASLDGISTSTVLPGGYCATLTDQECNEYLCYLRTRDEYLSWRNLKAREEAIMKSGGAFMLEALDNNHILLWEYEDKLFNLAEAWVQSKLPAPPAPPQAMPEFTIKAVDTSKTPPPETPTEPTTT